MTNANYQGNGSDADALLLADQSGVPVIGYAQEPTMTITEFLKARIAEDEAEANGQADAEYYVEGAWPEGMAARVLAECAAKRAIMAVIEPTEWMDNRAWGGYTDAMTGVLHHLAAVYVDHPDYRQEWAG